MGFEVYIVQTTFDVCVTNTKSAVAKAVCRQTYHFTNQLNSKQRVSETWCWARSFLSSVWDLTPEKPVWGPMRVKESQASSGEDEVRMGLTKRILCCAQCPRLPPLILPHNWFGFLWCSNITAVQEGSDRHVWGIPELAFYSFVCEILMFLITDDEYRCCMGSARSSSLMTLSVFEWWSF